MAEQLTWPDLLASLLRREDLSVWESTWAMRQVMAGEATPSQLAGFLVALRAKGETVDEIVGFRDAILEAALPLPVDPNVLDIVGTGGDRFGTVNVSTMSAIVAAATGVPVVKHGNRAASSSSGLLRRAGGPRHRPVALAASRWPRPSTAPASRSRSPRRSIPGSGTRGRPGRELGRADRLQLPRAALQPRARRGERRRCRAPRPRAPHHGRLPHARRDRPRLPRRRRARRADDDGTQPGVGGQPRRRARARPRPARPRHPVLRHRRAAGRRPAAQRRRRAAGARRRGRAGPRHRAAEHGGRASSPSGSRRTPRRCTGRSSSASRRRWMPRPRPSTTARPSRSSTPGSRRPGPSRRPDARHPPPLARHVGARR